ncbi:hypothetical protein Tco_1349641, partial [Tanacetum coccineum]
MERLDKIPIGDRGGFGAWFANRVWGWRVVATPQTSPIAIPTLLQVSKCFNPEEKVIINPKYPEQTVTIGRQLPTKAKQRLIKLLKDNADVFAWQYSDMTRIPRTLKIRDGAWRMCVDFTDINKACPKDCYSLPEIDWKVDLLFDFKLKCFLDAYKGYHQIQMAKEDKHKIAFHVPQGVYCYQKMPFELKNTGATYQ